MKILHRFICSLVLALMLPVAAPAEFINNLVDIPIERLIGKAEAYLKAHPREANAWYSLARMHYLAFAIGRSVVQTWPDDNGESEQTGEPEISDIDPSSGTWVPDNLVFHSEFRPPKYQFINHALLAYKDFQQAIRLNPADGLYQLGLASMLEQFRSWSEQTKLPASVIPPEFQDTSTKTLRASYYKAFAAAIAKDRLLKQAPVAGGWDGLVSQEAGAAFIWLAKDPHEPLTSKEKHELAEVKSGLARIKNLPQTGDRIVTPIVFAFRPVAHLTELLEPSHLVDFDLRGYGPRGKWPWVKPETGILVWDPRHLGKITSARQLFGNYTFQLFWKTGYDALAALDDNSDGYLTGSELDGISVWFDRNGDGICTPDEVIPARDLGITAIAVSFQSYDGIHPTNPRGIILRDGSALRTWDWMAAPANNPKPQQHGKAN